MASPSRHGFTTKASTTTPPDVVAYRLGDKLVYVTPAESYEQALKYAYSEFPDELHDVPRDRVRFFLTAQVSQKSRISQMAWKVVVQSLKRYDIIDIEVQTDEPPQYNSGGEENAGSHLRASPDSKGPSRSPSPDPSSIKKGARGWMDNLKYR